MGELMAYLHSVVFIPVESTWIKTVKQEFFTGWPGLSQKKTDGSYLITGNEKRTSGTNN